MKLRKKLFSRRSREGQFGDIFNRVSSLTTLLFNFLLAALFTPAVIATSLLSKDVVLMTANILLSLAYLSNFGYRLYTKDISLAEILISAAGIALAVMVTLYLAPAVLLTTALGVLSYTNLIATAVNSFFLLKNIVVPPLKAFIERVVSHLGCDIKKDYFYIRPLTLEEDRHLIDDLLNKHFKHDSFSKDFDNKEVQVFNRIIAKLQFLINTYQQDFLGSYIHAEQIKVLEKCIKDLIIDSNADSSFKYIKSRLADKTTTLNLLQEAKETVENCREIENSKEVKQRFRFFENYRQERILNDRDTLVDEAVACLESEIKQEEENISSLKLCIP